MPATRGIARIVANPNPGIGGKITAGSGPHIIDCASHIPPQLAFQRDATRRSGIGPAHAHDPRRHRHSEFGRDPGTFAIKQFRAMKIHAESRATRTTGQTSGSRHRSVESKKQLIKGCADIVAAH